MRYNVFLFFIFCYSLCFTQTTAYYNSSNYDYSFNVSTKKNINKIPFYFPSLIEGEVSFKGFYYTNRKNNIILSKIDSSNKPRLVYLSFFAKNIKTIILKTSLLGDCNDIIINPRNGYNLPSKTELNCDILVNENYKRLSFELEPLEESKDFFIVIKNLFLATENIIQKVSPSPIFFNQFFENIKYKDTLTLTKFNSYGIYKDYPANQYEEFFKSSVIVSDTISPPINVLEKTINVLLNKYPFFEERNVSKKKSAIDIDKIFNKRERNICNVIDELNLYLKVNFNDPHFKISSYQCRKKKQRKTTPIYLYSFHNRAEVAAIFDDKISLELEIGSEIISINNTSIDEDFLSKNNVNNFIKGFVNDTIHLKIKSLNKRIVNYKYIIKSRYKIPSNFRPKNLTHKSITKNISYYKINRINSLLLVDFLSKIDNFNTKEKLIIDLRGNGGGDFIAGAQFLSYFVYNDFNYFNFESRGLLEPVLIKNHVVIPKINKNLSLAILIDKNTSCVAELIAYKLRNLKENVLVVGKENSKGALAHVYEIALPGDIKIKSNSISTGKIILKSNSIESIGLSPDILVKIESIYDLQPYSDKVLKKAIVQ